MPSPPPHGVIGLFYFMVKDPKRLQTEAFLIKQASLDLIKSKGMKAPLDPALIELIADPEGSPVKKPAALPRSKAAGVSNRDADTVDPAQKVKPGRAK